MKTRITISFESDRQSPYFMIIKEYRNDHGKVYHAEIIYQEDNLDSDIALVGDYVLKRTQEASEILGTTAVEPWV